MTTNEKPILTSVGGGNPKISAGDRSASWEHGPEANVEPGTVHAVNVGGKDSTSTEPADNAMALSRDPNSASARAARSGGDSSKKFTLNKTALMSGALAVALVCSVGSAIYCIYDYSRGDAEITFNTAVGNNAVTFADGEASIADVATKVSESVVSIVTETRTTSYWGLDSTSSAAGSGMIISADGYVMTNKHVIEDASTIYVVLDDGSTYENVQVVAEDPLNDVAFLKIPDVSGLEPIALGDSTTLSVGQQVIAIGNALGQYNNSVTSGIISGTGRSITATDSSYSSYETLSDMIQTDAAINSGNSGGPLVNAAGEVIGINTAISADGDNIGFAIPVTSVKGMVSQLLASGSASRSYLGIYYVDLTPSVAEEYGLAVDYGAYVYSGETTSGYFNFQNTSAVVSGGPADQAGIKDGDVILSVNGVQIGSAGSLSTLIGAYAPGDTVQLKINREGSELALNLTLGAYPE